MDLDVPNIGSDQHRAVSRINIRHLYDHQQRTGRVVVTVYRPGVRHAGTVVDDGDWWAEHRMPVGAVHGDVPPTVNRPLPPDAGTMRSERP